MVWNVHLVDVNYVAQFALRSPLPFKIWSPTSGFCSGKNQAYRCLRRAVFRGLSQTKKWDKFLWSYLMHCFSVASSQCPFLWLGWAMDWCRKQVWKRKEQWCCSLPRAYGIQGMCCKLAVFSQKCGAKIVAQCGPLWNYLTRQVMQNHQLL